MEDAMTTHAEAWKSASEPFGRAIHATAALVTARLRQLAVAFRHRHDATALQRFDNRMLADIGLTRRDVREAFNEPLWRDPTDLLANRVVGRGWLIPRRPRAPSIVPEVGRARAVDCPGRF
jgi:uncharacterized protein YjiS (DUF1127 family)